MTDRPIIFSAPMVRAKRAGRKTMTRRLAWREHHLAGLGFSDEDRAMIAGKGWKIEQPRPSGLFYVSKPSPWQKVQPGDRLWVRENHYLTVDGHNEFAVYAADPGDVEKHLATINALGPDFPKATADRHRKLRPAIHMPRWASRLTLIVTATKIERLQDISEADSQAEGVRSLYGEPFDIAETISDRRRFELLWKHLHGPEAWDANPEVVALTFTVHNANIDALEPATK